MAIGRDDGGIGGRALVRPPESLVRGDVADLGLLLDECGNAFAVLWSEGQQHAVPLHGKLVRQVLSDGLSRVLGSRPRPEEMNSLIDELDLFTRRHAPVRTLHRRVARSHDSVWIDLGKNDAHPFVRIDKHGWAVVGQAEPVFVRGRSFRPLPVPASELPPVDFGRFLNVSTEHLPLLLAFAVHALCGRGPFPVLLLHGEQGAAKSTTSRFLKALIDPSAAPVRAMPSSERDLVISAQNAWLLAYDNVSSVSNAISDALCRLATGGGLATRKLYTDADEVVFEASRPLLLNGIGQVCDRQDLLDRSLVASCPPINREQRKSETGLCMEFEQLRPVMLGHLFSAVSYTLKHEENVVLNSAPRMADFARTAVAALGYFGHNSDAILELLASNQADMNSVAFEADTVAVVVDLFMESREEWKGSATELLNALHAINEPFRSGLPRVPSQLTNGLIRCSASLRSRGIVVETGLREGHGGQRKIRLRKNPPNFAGAAVTG